MKTKFIEVTNNNQNWGKFMLFRFGAEEYLREAMMATPEFAGTSLLKHVGWNPDMIWVMDLQTREGAAFLPGGYVKADLEKHRVWVCPMFEPFLEWLYKQDVSDLDKLPDTVNLPDAEFALSGYRRKGPDDQEAQPLKYDQEIDYTLKEEHDRVWIGVKNVSVSIHRADEGVVVDLYPKDREASSDSIGSTHVLFSEAEPEEEEDESKEE